MADLIPPNTTLKAGKEAINAKIAILEAEGVSHQTQINAEQQNRIAADNAHAAAAIAHTADQVQYVQGQSVKQKVDAQQAQIENIIGGPASSAAEVIDMRLGADGVARATAGTLVRQIHAEQLESYKQVTTLKRLGVATASQASGLDLAIGGRTLVNLLGRDGGCESLTPFVLSGMVEASSTQKRSGINSIKLTGSNSITNFQKDYSMVLDVTKSYVIGAWFFIESWTSGAINLTIRDYATTNVRYQADVNTAAIGSWQFVYVKVPVSNTVVGSGFRMRAGIASASTTVYYVDEIRLYEVSAADYAKIGVDPEYTGTKLDEKFPYVDSVQHLNTPTIRKRGKNLLPPLTQITMYSSAVLTVVGPYEYTMLTVAANINGSFIIDVAPNTDYVFSMDCGVDGQMAIYTMAVISITAYGNTARVFNSGVNTQIKVYFRKTSAGTNTFKNMQLELGNVATAFEPQNDDVLYIPAILASNVDGSVKDTYNGALNTVTRRNKTGVVLDGSLPWIYSMAAAGFKAVGLAEAGKYFADRLRGLSSIPLCVKYDGKIILLGATSTAADIISSSWWQHATGNEFYISMSAVDAGWTDAYTPTTAEIQAYFNGWRMNNGSLDTPFASGTKKWTALESPKADFSGKISGSTVANPHISKNTAANTLISPLAGWFAEETSAQYENFSTLNGFITGHNNSTSGNIIQLLLSFNVIEHVIRKHGVSKFGAAVTTADRVAWLKTNVERFVCNVVSNGSGPTGNRVTLARWRSDNNSWYTASVATHTAATPTKLSTEMAVGGALPPTNGIDANGFVHFILYAEASNGTITSRIEIDAVDLEVYLNLTTLPAGYSTVDFTPYQLSYQLAATIEEVISVEGSIGLQSGGNQVELFEGVVIREKVTPKYRSSDARYFINVDGLKIGSIGIGGEASKKVGSISRIFKNGQEDLKWVVYTDTGTAYGNQYASVLAADYDAMAEYTVTYVILDKYNRTTNAYEATVTYETSAKSVQDRMVSDIVNVETQSAVNVRAIAELFKRVKALGG